MTTYDFNHYIDAQEKYNKSVQRREVWRYKEELKIWVELEKKLKSIVFRLKRVDNKSIEMFKI